MSEGYDTDPDDDVDPEHAEGHYVDALDTSPETPTVTAPDAPDPGTVDAGDVDPEVRTAFWKLVFAVKFALLGLTLGALFLVFEGSTGLGGQLLAVGLGACVYGIYRYRTVKTKLDDGDATAGEAASDPGEEAERTDDRAANTAEAETTEESR